MKRRRQEEVLCSWLILYFFCFFGFFKSGWHKGDSTPGVFSLSFQSFLSFLSLLLFSFLSLLLFSFLSLFSLFTLFFSSLSFLYSILVNLGFFSPLLWISIFGQQNLPKIPNMLLTK
jgi:hypothetical protein